MNITYLDKDGNPTDSEKRAVCSSSCGDEGITHLFIKYDGSLNIFDPNDMYYKDGDECKLDDRKGGYVFKFRQVSLKAYELYIQYLKTGKQKFLTQVKMELINYNG